MGIGIDKALPMCKIEICTVTDECYQLKSGNTCICLYIY